MCQDFLNMIFGNKAVVDALELSIVNYPFSLQQTHHLQPLAFKSESL